MGTFELTKAEKKLARQIIDVGIQIEYANGLKKQSVIIEKWQLGEVDNKDAYLKLYESVIEYDKHIARRYDDMRGSTYLFIIAGLLADRIISTEEISRFRDEVKDILISLSGIERHKPE